MTRATSVQLATFAFSVGWGAALAGLAPPGLRQRPWLWWAAAMTPPMVLNLLAQGMRT